MFGIKVKRLFPLLQNCLLSFDFNIRLIAILAIVNVLYKIRFTGDNIIAASNLWNPTWLLFGPAFYFAYRSLRGKDEKLFRGWWWHYVPFLLFSLFYGIAFLTTKTENVWDNPLYTRYQNSFFVISLLLMAYAFYGLKRRKEMDTREREGELLIFLSGFLALIAVLYGVMYFCWGVFNINMGVDYRLFTYAILLIMDIFIFRYYMMGKDQAYSSKTDPAVSGLNPVQADRYMEKLRIYFSDQESFINPNLSLETLSKDLDIPKHHFSLLFNQHLGKNFYSYVAEHRINYAIQRLQDENGKLKIESLAYACGFNSKTAFNRYFKQITGRTPLQYIQQKEGASDGSLR